MTRQDTMQEIIDQMNRSAEAFAQQSGAMACETFSVFKKGDQAENIKQHFAELVYPAGYVLLFQYTAHGLLSYVNSILECYLMVDGYPSYPYPLFHVAGFLKAVNPMLLTIPMITDGTTMQDAFSQLTDFIGSIRPRLEALAADPEERTALCRSFLDHVFAETKTYITAVDEEAVWTLDLFYSLMTNHLAGDPYLRYMYGNPEKAVIKLERLKYKSDYELQLIPLLHTAPAQTPIPPSIQENIRAKYNKNGNPKNNGKEFWVMFLSWFVWAAIWGVFFVGIFFLFYFVESRNADLVMGPMAQLPFLFLPSFLMGICSSYYSRDLAFRLLLKKSYQKQKALDHIENGPGSDRVIKVLSTLLLIAGMCFTMLTVKWNVKLLPTGIADNSSFFSLKETFYRYEEVERVYYQPNRMIDGEAVDFPSYVIALKSGKEIDLYDFTVEESDYDEFLTLIRQKGIPVEKQP